MTLDRSFPVDSRRPRHNPSPQKRISMTVVHPRSVQPRSAALSLFTALVLVSLSFIAMSLTAKQAFTQDSAAWPQWGQNPQHTGYLPVAGQSLQGKLSDQTFDPF